MGAVLLAICHLVGAAGRLWAVAGDNLTIIRGNTDGDPARSLEIAIQDGGVLAQAYTAADFLV